MTFVYFGTRSFNTDNIVSVGVIERKTRSGTYYSVCIKTTATKHPYYTTREYDTRKEAEDRMAEFFSSVEENEHEEGEELEDELVDVVEEGEELEEELDLGEPEALGDRLPPKEKEEDEGNDLEDVLEEGDDLDEDPDLRLFYICPGKKCKCILPLSLDAFSTEMEYFCQCGKQIELPSNVIACAGFDY